MNIKTETKSFLLYVLVGAIATVVEWGIFSLLSIGFSLHYEISTVIAYVVATFVNWLAGRLILFKKSEKNIITEILQIYLVSIIGLVLNLGFMWIFVDLCNIYELISKIIATALVFIWNYLSRKLLIYKKRG